MALGSSAHSHSSNNSIMGDDDAASAGWHIYIYGTVTTGQSIIVGYCSMYWDCKRWDCLHQPNSTRSRYIQDISGGDEGGERAERAVITGDLKPPADAQITGGRK